jgi:hypothetical protein
MIVENNSRVSWSWLHGEKAEGEAGRLGVLKAGG